MTHIILPDGDDWEELVSAGIQATASEDSARWAHGDLAMRVATRYGESSMAKYAAAINKSMKTRTLYERMEVAAFFPPAVREKYAALAWSHFRAVSRACDEMTQAEAWLAQAEDEGWTVDYLEDMLKGNRAQVRRIITFEAPPYQAPERLATALENCAVLLADRLVTVKVYQEQPREDGNVNGEAVAI
jgi:hypothetical protein